MIAPLHRGINDGISRHPWPALRGGAISARREGQATNDAFRGSFDLVESEMGRCSFLLGMICDRSAFRGIQQGRI
jgi:hypothetical protein